MRTDRAVAPQRNWRPLACMSVAAAMYGPPALAEFKIDNHLSSQIEYDSNVYRVSSATAKQTLGSSQRDDEILTSEAGSDIAYLWNAQRLYASGNVRRVLYRRASELDHNEFDWLGGLNWKLGSSVDGDGEYKMQRRMVPEENRALPTTRLDFETDHNAGGSVNLMIDPQWRAESRVDWVEQDSPSQDALFHLDETKYTLGAKYLGLGPVNMGLQAQYLTGTFDDGIQNGPYRQVNLDYTLDYKSGSLSQLSMLLGGSRRRGRNGSSESFSGFTGELHYKRFISGKTTLGADFFRRVESYAVLADYVAETGGDVNMDWQATPKLFVNLLVSFTDDSFQVSARKDQLLITAFSLKYQPITWFFLKPTVQYESRHSNQTVYSFVDTVVGLQGTLQF
jgi:hypothetical protein